MIKSIHLSIDILNSISLIIILVTGILELYSPFGIFISWGFSIGILLTMISKQKYYTIIAASLSSFLLLLAFFYSGDAEALKIPLLIYSGVGMCTTTFFVLWIIHREGKAENSRAQMAGIFSHGTQGIVLIDDNHTIVLVNPYGEKLFGYTSNELVGNRIEMLIPRLILSEQKIQRINSSLPEFDQALAAGEQLLAHRKDGRIFPIEISSNRYQAGNEKYAVIFLTDITVRKQNEQILIDRTKELEVVNQELEAFSYSVSHDLRSPLRIIDGFASMLEEDYCTVLDSEGKRLLRNIQQSAGKMGRLIDDLLNFSRLGRQKIKKSSVNMTQLVENSLFEINQTLKHNAEVIISPLHPVIADPSLMNHVVINLLSNAIKYSSKTKSPRIEVKSKLENNRVVFCVSDNGAGFDMKYIHKLFGVFQRLHTNNEFEGIGVGLAIAERIIHKHGGKIWAEGKVAEGASFYFSLGTDAEDEPLIEDEPQLVFVKN